MCVLLGIIGYAIFNVVMQESLIDAYIIYNGGSKWISVVLHKPLLNLAQRQLGTNLLCFQFTYNAILQR